MPDPVHTRPRVSRRLLVGGAPSSSPRPRHPSVTSKTSRVTGGTAQHGGHPTVWFTRPLMKSPAKSTHGVSLPHVNVANV
jgi:hypothetical protein